MYWSWGCGWYGLAAFKVGCQDELKEDTAVFTVMLCVCNALVFFCSFLFPCCRRVVLYAQQRITQWENIPLHGRFSATSISETAVGGAHNERGGCFDIFPYDTLLGVFFWHAWPLSTKATWKFARGCGVCCHVHASSTLLVCFVGKGEGRAGARSRVVTLR